jgi:hypothetical protein
MLKMFALAPLVEGRILLNKEVFVTVNRREGENHCILIWSHIKL